MKWGANPFNPDLSNTADIGLGYAKLTDTYLHPKILEPRFAADYILDANDNVRVSYGRSVSFFFGQTAGTPTGMIGVDPVLYRIPAKDSAALPACGSGWHGPGMNGHNTYSQNPNVFFSGAGTLNQPGWYFQCPNYASSVYWNFDQNFSAPDIGGQQPATSNNWDFAYGHQFKNGWGTKLTAYDRRGFNTYQTTLLAGGPPDPVTGQFTNGAFQERETGTQRAFGLEFLLTTPDRTYGWSGFLTANYVNELTNTPPVPGSDSLPSVQQYLYLTGLYWHQSYLPPLSATAGIQYKTKSGFKVNPIFNADAGVPFGVGRSSAGFINGVLYSNIPTGNLGVAMPYAGLGQPNQSYNATCYYDPAFAGSYFHPKYFACRGFSEPALAGQAFTRPRLYSDLDLEYNHKRVTYGVYVSNLFDNYRAEPTINQRWQPLATGVGGAQTGQLATTYPIQQDGSVNPFYNVGFRDASRYDEYWLPYQRLYVPGRTYRFYVQLKI
ncbi:MAG: hypothetical protein JO103_05290 [Candidatus Eremiobacteraeota bacterium]|nr:hypothetical protein [Candidatus Eremiobacteraeota bacterium]